MTTHSKTSAAQAVASTFGILVGLAGIMHGIFEILQGNVAPSSLLSEAIGPSQRFWEYGTLHALTVVPNYLVTGILAVIAGISVVVWAAVFIHTKYGAVFLALFTGTLFLVGGGFAPIFTSILAIFMATRINNPLIGRRRLLPKSPLRFLGNI